MKKPWIDTRLSQKEMDFVWGCKASSGEKAENTSYSVLLEDKDNWFYESVLKKLTERMFYRDEVEEGKPLPEFEMSKFWVNYMKRFDFNPLHDHPGLYSFVIFMKIPTHWKAEHFRSHFDEVAVASDFQFVWSKRDSESCIKYNYQLSPEDEGRMLFFPSTLQHQVYPFYGTDEERITINGTIHLMTKAGEERDT